MGSGSSRSPVIARLAVLCLMVLFAVDDDAESLAVDVLKSLKAALEDDRIERVEELLHDVDLVYVHVTPKTQRKLIKALDGLLKAKPRSVRDDDGRPPEQRLQRAYGLAIGILYDKPRGPEVLRGALKLRHLQEWWSVRAMLYEGLAFSLDPDDIGRLAAGLGEGAPEVVGAAARGLGLFETEPVAVRRVALEALIEGWEDLHEAVAKAARRKQGDGAKELLRDVEPALGDAVSALAHRRLSELDDARSWFDEHAAEEDW